MGRNRTFDEADVIERCAAAFRSTGYEGTSIDDLVQATGLHRGSLYKAFGSKRGLFLEALRQTSNPPRVSDPPRDGGQHAHAPRERRQQESTRDDSARDDSTPEESARSASTPEERTDLLLVALMELAPRDPEIRTLAFAILDAPEHALDSRALGERLLARALEDPTTTTPTTSIKEPA